MNSVTPIIPSLADAGGQSAAGQELDGCAVVYFGNDWAAENRTSSHHIAQRLAARMPLLYVDSPGMRAPQVSGRDLRKAWAKLRQAVRLPVPVRDGFWRCTVPQLPFRGVPGVELINHLFARWALRRAIRHLGFQRFLTWFALPHPGAIAHHLGEQAVIYYCIDDYAAHPGVDAERIQRCDDQLARTADRVFVAPPALMDGKRQLNSSATFSPHGVDAALFAQAADPATAPAAPLVGLAGPVVGFFGSVADWVDIPLVAQLARQRPAYHFVLVGHVSTDVSALDGLPNVLLAGAQPYPELPRWARAFDVAIIPYRRNRQVMNANPLKLREYLATGKPVVAVSTPEIDRFADLVAIADSPEAFLAAIDRAVLDKDAQASARRMQSVADWTWEARVDATLAIVAQDLRRMAGSSKAPLAARTQGSH